MIRGRQKCEKTIIFNQGYAAVVCRCQKPILSLRRSVAPFLSIRPGETPQPSNAFWSRLWGRMLSLRSFTFRIMSQESTVFSPPISPSIPPPKRIRFVGQVVFVSMTFVLEKHPSASFLMCGQVQTACGEVSFRCFCKFVVTALSSKAWFWNCHQPFDVPPYPSVPEGCGFRAANSDNEEAVFMMFCVGLTPRLHGMSSTRSSTSSFSTARDS